MLDTLLPNEAFGFVLITVRLSIIFLVIPVLGDRSIPTRIRAGFAFMLALIAYPSVQGAFPAVPEGVGQLIMLVFQETLIGAMLGLAVRILMSATHTAGTIIAFQTGLAAAQSFDPSQGTQGALVAAFLNLIAITLILVTDLHHLMIMAIVHSYTNFPVGEAIPFASFATVATRSVADSFMLGFQLSTPFLVYGIVFNVGLGLIGRMIPGFQVFFVGLPMNIAVGFLLFAFLMGSMMTLFLDRFKDLLLGMLG